MKSITQVMQNLVKPYIDNQDKAYAANIAPVEVSPAEATHTAGTQLIYNGVLYDVTANIAINDDLATEGAGANISAASKVTEQISSQNEALTNEVSARAELGAHNLWMLKIAKIKAANTNGSWTGNVYNYGGLEYILDADNYGNLLSVTIVGTNNAGGALMFNLPISYTPSKDIILNGCPTGGGSNSYQLDANDGIYADRGDGVSITANTAITSSRIRTAKDYAYATGGVVFRPMIRIASDPSTEFTPYAMTNRELTDEVTASHSLGLRIDISSYNSSNNKYTCASDGYVYIQIDSDSNCTYLSALLSDGTAATTVYKQTAGSGSGNALVYVPKGMSVYFDCDNASPTKIVCRFIPIV